MITAYINPCSLGKLVMHKNLLFASLKVCSYSLGCGINSWIISLWSLNELIFKTSSQIQQAQNIVLW